jgi:hypothetical protein
VFSQTMSGVFILNHIVIDLLTAAANFGTPSMHAIEFRIPLHGIVAERQVEHDKVYKYPTWYSLESSWTQTSVNNYSHDPADEMLLLLVDKLQNPNIADFMYVTVF